MSTKFVKISAALGGRILSSLRGARMARDSDPASAAGIEAELVKELTDGNVLEAVEEAVEEAVLDEKKPAADTDKGQVIAAIMELVGKGSLDDAGKATLADLLAKLAAAPTTDEGAKPEQASDEKAAEAPAQDEKDEKGMSAEEVKKTAEDAATSSVLPRIQAVMDAQRDVQAVVGEVRVNFARDRAEDIYGVALDHMGISRAGMPRTAYRHVFLTARDAMNDGRGMVRPARDAAPASAKEDFEHLKNLRVRRA